MCSCAEWPRHNFRRRNMVFVWDAEYLAVAPHFHGSNSSLELCCEGPWFTSIQEDGCDKGAVKGGRRQGRQRKGWEGNIREWTGLEFAKSQTAVENRGKWRNLVEESSVVCLFTVIIIIIIIYSRPLVLTPPNLHFCSLSKGRCVLHGRARSLVVVMCCQSRYPSLSPDVILCGWLGSKHQLTN